MRRVSLVGLIAVLLIIGIRVVKNMDSDDPNSIQQTQSEEYMEKTPEAADDVKKRQKDIKNLANGADWHCGATCIY